MLQVPWLKPIEFLSTSLVANRRNTLDGDVRLKCGKPDLSLTETIGGVINNHPLTETTRVLNNNHSLTHHMTTDMFC